MENNWEALVVPAVFGATVASEGKPADNENASKSCKPERASLGVDAFSKRYGTNSNLRNAFGKCVSGRSKTKTERDQTLDAAKQCKNERVDMGGVAFANNDGTNHKANAFGKCVSPKAKASGKDEDADSATDAEEADDDDLLSRAGVDDPARRA